MNIQQLRAQIAVLQDATMDENRNFRSDYDEGRFDALSAVDALLDSSQDEPVKIKKGCKYRCLSDMANKDTGNISFIGGKIYLAPEDNTLVTEEYGWRCDTSENASNFELVEEPQVKESAKVQHVDKMCKENGNSLTQEPVSNDFEEVVKKLWNEINSGHEYSVIESYNVFYGLCLDIANWQRTQMMAKAIEGDVTFDFYGFDGKTYGCIAHNSFCLDDFGLKDTDKVKMIIVKDEMS